LTRLGTIALPAFVGCLKAIDAVLEGMNKALGWATKQAVGPDGKPMMLDEQPGYAGLWGPSQAHAAEPTVAGRDPRSPSSAAGNVTPYSSSTIHAPSAVAPNVSISSPVTAPLTGTMTNNITINNVGLLSEVKQVVKSEIQRAFSGLMSMFRSGVGNSAASFDGRAAPQSPDMSGSIVK
jgi:hypothetical protein